LPQWAKDGLAYGVKALLLSGWKVGGHDDGVPRFEPNPKLGTDEELVAALRKCHQLGVKVFFLVNIQPVAKHNPWYRDELHKYACMNPWGVVYPTTMGWRAGATLSEGIGSGERRVWLNPGSTGFRKLFTSQIKQLAELGADGVYLKSFFPKKPLDFNPELKTTPDRACWEENLKCLDEILQACRAVNPEFCISIDGVRDRLLQYTDISGVEMVEPSAFKTVFPFWQATLSVLQGNQFDVVNNALRYGAQLRIAPVNHTASMRHESMKELSAYIKEILRIREELKDTLIWGEFLGTEQTHVQGEVPYSTFRNPKTGQRACVLVNNGTNTVQSSVSGFEGCDSGTVVIYQPFERPRQATLPVTVHIPANRAAVVAEKIESSKRD
jgi:hypothetical protein